MPVWSLAMASASNAGWTPAPPPGGRPWWLSKMGAGSGGVSLNKLAGTAASRKSSLMHPGCVGELAVLLLLELWWSELHSGRRSATSSFPHKLEARPLVLEVDGGHSAVLGKLLLFLPLAGRGGEGRKGCCLLSPASARWCFGFLLHVRVTYMAAFVAAVILGQYSGPSLCRRQGVVSICGVSGRGRWFVQVSLCFCLWLAEVAKGEEVEVLDLFLDGVVVVVVLCGVFAPAGRGGEGSGRLEDGCDGWLVWLLRSRREDWWSVDAGARLSSFIVLGVRCVAATGSAAFFNVGGACFPGLGGTAFSGGG